MTFEVVFLAKRFVQIFHVTGNGNCGPPETAFFSGIGLLFPFFNVAFSRPSNATGSVFTFFFNPLGHYWNSFL